MKVSLNLEPKARQLHAADFWELLWSACLMILESRSAVFLAPSDSRGSDALPGVRVRAYPTSPTRDDRLEAAESAAQVRADEARRIAIKSRRDQKILQATSATKSSPGHPDKVVRQRP